MGKERDTFDRDYRRSKWIAIVGIGFCVLSWSAAYTAYDQDIQDGIVTDPIADKISSIGADLKENFDEAFDTLATVTK